MGSFLEVTKQNTGTGSELVGPLAELLGASIVCDLLQPHKEGNPATGHHVFLQVTGIYSNLFLCIWISPPSVCMGNSCLFTTVEITCC